MRSLPAELAAWLPQRRAELGLNAEVATPDLDQVLLASDLAFDVFRREPDLITHFLTHGEIATSDLPALDDPDFAGALRRYRRRGSLALIVADVLKQATVAETLLAATALAERCIEHALQRAEAELTPRFGQARHPDGLPMRLAVIGMGKLGGGELNFSSDVDLILTFAEAGETDGPRRLSHEEFFTKVGQRLAQLLGDVSVDGFVARVDYRLRPFGSAGRLAWTFDAMEHYYQREGRDWERYAWIKARTVAGDRAGGATLIDTLRPFIYRRYLDFTAIEGLREMKSRIDLEVDRRDLDGNLKLGPGGIRECEFMVQLAQLIRGGRESKLRTPSFYRALSAAIDSGFLTSDEGNGVRDHYEFLRRVENRVQMFADEQTHALPHDTLTRRRIAWTLGYADTAALDAAIGSVRHAVGTLFQRVLDPPARNKPLRLGEELTETPAQLIEHFGSSVAEAFHSLLNSLAVRRMDTAAKSRFERATPRLLHEANLQALTDPQVERLLRLLYAIAGRSSYLALLAERRGARERVVEVFKRSSFLAERVIAHPLLLDELLDERQGKDFDPAREFAQHLARAPQDDPEALLTALNEARQSALFRIGLDWLAGRLQALACSQALSQLAELSLHRAYELVRREHEAQHGRLGDGLLVVAYGSFGGAELGFASDLDLVFLYCDVDDEQLSDGPRPLDRARYFARMAQRLLHWLGTSTRAGSLYEVDMRLRPDGAKGLLVSSLRTFADYQQTRAWTYEQQALVRARVVCGAESGREHFARVRADVLAKPRDPDALHTEVRSMRARWRQELDRSDHLHFDLKQGEGGLVDLEFFLQRLVLAHGCQHPELLRATETWALIDQANALGLISGANADTLRTGHQAWLHRALDCTLDGRPRVIMTTPEVQASAEIMARLLN
ncbi:bifunctional [glutamate--ammonia ligase]-adenylyl-L-tyrosine phosphorylase/[glutamate--ammonia-ligase] adenylyltransferase [Ahniella affigens]|uniref:bifunctional [glutamate--ammonia ligase]-adenylyl-L-tyrosine phosphorylase/[glutamate--ammonia-ligase] adenylyltransferase n=1 Tax=Ahniella affigens TaxID=2021234 RepID=UPI0014767CBC|nr:bifunctional [glutamate--ammonia ligase]-adenylyl-L-tyrosine phosphorylase/[glutamate--ammonia-ligase] adenylyltransferase [Ahniella affigens]